MNEKFRRFQNAVRPDVRLRISLDEYIRLSEGAEKDSSVMKEYGAYLFARRRAAWEILIREENLDGLRLFAKEGWLTGEDARGCLDLAVKTGKRESQLWLLQYMKGLEKAGTEDPAEIYGQACADKSCADKSCADKSCEEKDCRGKSYGENNCEGKDCGKRDRREKDYAEIGREIFAVLKQNLQSRIPALSSAFPELTCVERERKKSDEIVWGTDGKNLYCTRDELISLFRAGMDNLARKYLHSLFHCLYLHMLYPNVCGSFSESCTSFSKSRTSFSESRTSFSESCISFSESGMSFSKSRTSFLENCGLSQDSAEECWNLACDLAVEWAIDASSWYPLDFKRQKMRSTWYRRILDEQKGRDTKSCYHWLLRQRKEGQCELLQEMRKEFFSDCHSYWQENGEDPEKKSLEEQEHLVQTWENARQGLSRMSGGSGQKAGQQGGGIVDEYRSVNKKTYDYRRFLKQFSICREEMQLDMESFDYIPYHYGLERYGNVLLVEPLETTEVNRLEEFVIAIDTSGSCSGEIVCRFLDETYRILSSRENFFRKMNVHLIQCDSVIQDHRRITCEEDWMQYRENVKIQGMGGTDFTPVFRLVDKMIEQKEIRNLKGLVYFTDGDGIFPRHRPSYETAFVFLNRALEKSRIPDWAIRLNLEMQ